MDASLYERFLKIAFRFLSFRPRSVKELRDHLLAKKAPRDVIENVIVFLQEKKFLDDAEFVRWWIGQRVKNRPKALWLIKKELEQKGIGQDYIQEIVEKQKGHMQDDLATAKKIITKKIDRLQDLSRFELINKLGSYLARRGYSFDTIKRAIDEVLSERV